MKNSSQPHNMRPQIMETARHLFQTKGYDITTFKDITDLLKIKEQLVLKFFRSKDDLLEAVWSES